MDMIVEISIGVVALAFVILVIYLVLLIKSLCKTLSRLDQLNSDLMRKSEALNPLFHAVNQTGQILEKKATLLKKNFEEECLLDEESDDLEKKSLTTAAALLELAGVGVSIWNKFRRRR